MKNFQDKHARTGPFGKRHDNRAVDCIERARAEFTMLSRETDGGVLLYSCNRTPTLLLEPCRTDLESETGRRSDIDGDNRTQQFCFERGDMY